MSPEKQDIINSLFKEKVERWTITELISAYRVIFNELTDRYLVNSEIVQTLEKE